MKKTLTLLVIGIVLSISILNAQAQLILTTQEEVDAVSTQPAIEIKGILTISGPDITSIDGFNNVVSVELLEIIDNPNLVSINGFANLERTNGSIVIENNPTLKTINGFSKLETMTGFFFGTGLRIINNASLESFDGFSSLQTISGRGSSLTIENNPLLTSLEPLSSLRFLEGTFVSLDIVNNAALKNLDGLRSLQRFGVGYSGLVDITGNQNLEHVDGLSAVVLTGSTAFLRLSVEDNPSLMRFCGLYSLVQGISQVDNSTTIIENNGRNATTESILSEGPCKPYVSGFSIINEKTGELVMEFSDDVTIDQADPDFSKWTIQVNTVPATVGSVRIKVDEAIYQTENVVPYTIPNYKFIKLSRGSYTLTAVPFSNTWERGTMGIGRSATVTVMHSLKILQLDLLDIQGNAMRTLQDNDTLYISAGGTAFHIGAVTSPEIVPSVKFWLNGVPYRVENVAPYVLAGDTPKQLLGWLPSPGNYQITAAAYSAKNASGYRGEVLEVNVTVLASPPQSVAGVEVYPVPAVDVLNVRFKNGQTIPSNLVVRDDQGVVINLFSPTRPAGFCQIDVSHLRPGLFYLDFVGKDGQISTVRFVKK